MANRTWTYEEITAQTEVRIKGLMKLAVGDGHSGHADWAFGVFLAWNTLTYGWQEDGDAKRLEALTEVRHG